MENINWISMIIATLVPMIAGFIWYHKAVLGQAWMTETGLTEEKIASANMGKTMGLSLVMSFLLAFFMLNFCNGIGQEGEFDTFKHGMAHGAIIGVFVIIPIFVTNGLFEQRSMKLTFINAIYWIITLMIMGGVLDAMNHFPNA